MIKIKNFTATDNEESNPIYRINKRLGFKPVPFSMGYSKKI